MITADTELFSGEGVSVTGIVDALINKAHDSKASDIHIDPTSKDLRVRLRIDGVLHDLHRFPQSIQSEIISRIKVLSGLRTDEHQATQDGRFRHDFEGGECADIRVSIIPTHYGENAVLRLLFDSASKNFTLDSLGFEEDDQQKIKAGIHKSSGMILVTGPTGSGKTTTLYTLMGMLNSKEVSLISIEDPIEYAIDGVEQIQVNSRSGLTFANGLRTILRQDPNIIMVGEIRDSDTASIAINTALTGHLLLSTLHTNDAATTLPRLLDMRIESFLVASTINVAIGQRLVRKICDHCKAKVKVTAALAKSLAGIGLVRPIAEGAFIWKGKGCEKCSDSGFSGRLCVAEVLVVDDEIRAAIIDHSPASTIRSIAVKNGMRTMLEDGFEKVRKGMTTPEEILRVIHE
ncbi:MAG: GspE/PulE family protein [Patescibacteria group bacterium]